jgi:hypothetical protein
MRKFLIAATGVAFAFGAADASLAAAAVPGALASSRDVAISPEQRARLAERLRIVEQTMRVVDADLRKQDNAAARRQWIVESLYSMPLEKLRALGNPPTSAALSDAITRVKNVQQKALGSTTVDLVYQPFVPCRFADTRVVGGKISPSRSFDISQNGNVYGGSAACNITTLAGVPDNAIGAVAMNVTLFDTSTAASPGFIGVRPVGSANLTSILNWNTSNPTAQDANTTIVAMDQSGATDEFEVFDSGPVQVIIDIMGVFTAPGATALDCTTVVTNGAGTVPTGNTFPFPIPTTCPTGYTGVAIACEYGPVPPAGLALTSVGAADVTTGFLTCLWRNESGATLQGSDFHTHTRCCRVPGR